MQKRPSILLLIPLFASAAFAAENLPIAIEPSPNGRVVTAGGTPFAEYRIDAAGKPVVWPLVGPNGITMTRQWPLGPQRKHESADHPHHIGLWFGYDKVNGADFWHRPAPPGVKSRRGRVVHRGFIDTGKAESERSIVTKNDWLTWDGKIVCRDTRTLHFGATPNRRWVDFMIEWRPHEKPLKLGDSKEGVFGLRVAGPLRIEANLDGEIVNSRGQRNAEAWGQRAEWVDYHGRIDNQLVGVAILSHPSNFRARPRWHVRGYGLFAANPLGEEDFPPIDGYQQGPVTINVGDQLRLRYRVVMHLGNEQDANIAALQREYGSQ